jgi:hypothetical protein
MTTNELYQRHRIQRDHSAETINMSIRIPDLRLCVQLDSRRRTVQVTLLAFLTITTELMVVRDVQLYARRYIYP